MIPVTQDLRKAVRSAHAAYKEQVEKEEGKKREEARQRKEISEREQKERD